MTKILWENSLGDAVKKAKESRKPILIDFFYEH